jgi:hypothetical protein
MLDWDPPILALRTTRTTVGQVVVEHHPKTVSDAQLQLLRTDSIASHRVGYSSWCSNTAVRCELPRLFGAIQPPA